MKKLIKKFRAPVPLKMRRLGNALLAVGGTITAAAIAEEVKIIAYIALGITVIGKFLMEYYAEDGTNL